MYIFNIKYFSHILTYYKAFEQTDELKKPDRYLRIYFEYNSI